MGFLNPLYHAFAWSLVHIHSGAAHLVGESAAWTLSVVLLTVAVRLLIFPLFVKQVKTQRVMQEMQPKIKELQARYKNDKEKLQLEMMALWREAGANPLSGCLPMLLQIPVFIALYHTLNEIKPKSNCTNTHLVSCYPSDIAGFPQNDLFSAAHAKLFGIAPISASFKTAKDTLLALGGHQGSTRAICLILVVIMATTTFLTTKQMMMRNAASPSSADMPAQMAQVQKIMLYVFPVMMLFYGFYFPVGVLLYWLTTNVWSMGQQYVIIHRQEPAAAAAAAATTVRPSGPAPGAKPKVPPRGPTAKPVTPASTSDQPAPAEPSPARPSRSTANIVLPPGGAIGPSLGGAARPATSPRANPNRSKKKKRKGRR
jgi:YidC/Oxa1 family membrane protein insertase